MVKAGIINGNNKNVFIDMFYKGLRNDVKDEAIKLNRNTSLENYISQAIRIDNQLFERRQKKKKETTRSKEINQTRERSGITFRPHPAFI